MSGSSVMKGEMDRLAWGTDAGFYRILPQEVLTRTLKFSRVTRGVS